MLKLASLITLLLLSVAMSLFLGMLTCRRARTRQRSIRYGAIAAVAFCLMFYLLTYQWGPPWEGLASAVSVVVMAIGATFSWGMGALIGHYQGKRIERAETQAAAALNNAPAASGNHNPAPPSLKSAGSET